MLVHRALQLIPQRKVLQLSPYNYALVTVQIFREALPVARNLVIEFMDLVDVFAVFLRKVHHVLGKQRVICILSDFHFFISLCVSDNQTLLFNLVVH